jgi:hypothetical protein
MCRFFFEIVKKKLFHYTPGQVIKISKRLRLQEFLDSRRMKVVSLSDLRTSCLNPVRRIPGTHFCYKRSRTQGHSAAGRIKSMKNYNDTIGNRTRELPACSALPQPTAPPRTPFLELCWLNITHYWKSKFNYHVLYQMNSLHTITFHFSEKSFIFYTIYKEVLKDFFLSFD